MKDKPNPRLSLVQIIGDTQVWLVDGRIVRDHWFLDFTEGGNDEVYHKWLPKNEIWLEERNQDEGRFILLHELHEHNCMKGKGMSYENAHISANKVEAAARREPRTVEQLIEVEIQKFCKLDGTDPLNERNASYKYKKFYSKDEE